MGSVADNIRHGRILMMFSFSFFSSFFLPFWRRASNEAPGKGRRGVAMSGTSFPCGIVECSPLYAAGCTKGSSPACLCKIPSFYGPTCRENVFVDSPAGFYALNVIGLVLMLFLSVMGT